MKNWEIAYQSPVHEDDIISVLLKNRGFINREEIERFLQPPDPFELSPEDVGIDEISLDKAVRRIQKAIDGRESIVVYADYDADGITAGAVMWEALHSLGAQVMPYIPHRVEEGYGLSEKGIDSVVADYHPSLIITVDHGITAKEKVAYAKKLGIDVVVTDHHVKPDELPECIIVHTTKLSGAGISWFVASQLLPSHDYELLALAAIGTIADLVPLVGPNRSITKYGLAAIRVTSRVGLRAIMNEAGLIGDINIYDISHILAPRLNAMGRLVHAMDALRLLCTKNQEKAAALAGRLGSTNKERQLLTAETTLHARELVKLHVKLLFVSHESYNQGIIGLVAGKLVEEFYRPAVVVAKGDLVSKASARSIAGFNIIEAIRSCSDLLVDVGGHPMAAGFTVETKNLSFLQERLEQFAEKSIDEASLIRKLSIDAEIPLSIATETLWMKIRDFEPFGFGNPEPTFASRNVVVEDTRLIGNEGKHLKLKLRGIDAVGFGMGESHGKIKRGDPIDVAYTIDMNTWNGNTKLQLKLKDIKVPHQSSFAKASAD